MHHDFTPKDRENRQGAGRQNAGRQSTDRQNADRQNVSVERQIAMLGGSIRANNRHRDAMLRQASESVVRSGSRLRSAQVVIGLSLALLVISPLLGALTRVEVRLPPTAWQTNAEALGRAQEDHLSFDWALVDVFTQFRENKRGS